MLLGELLLLLWLGTSRASSAAADSADTCKAVHQTSIKDACDLKKEVSPSSLALCNAENPIKTETECLKRNCCWDNGTATSEPKCFSKPRKCYIDLRREKCNQLHGYGINGIYTGYSANGSYCHVSQIALADKRVSETLGYHHNDGYEINPDVRCRSWWKYRAARLQNNECQVNVVNKTKPYLGKLKFNSSCIIEDPQQGNPYNFSLDKMERCMCRVEVWLQYEQETAKVSRGVLRYIQNLENRSSCTQVLGNIIRNSWRNRVAPVNRQEVEVVLDVLSNLTQPKDMRNLTYVDAEVLLHSTRKISGYSFNEGLGQSSAADMVERTTTAMSNLIWRFSQTDEAAASGPRSFTGHLAELRDAGGGMQALVERQPKQGEATSARVEEQQSRVKFDIFQTLESVTETIALHIQATEKKDFHIRADEEFVDLQILVTDAVNASNIVNRSHSINSTQSKNQVLITELPPNAEDSPGDSVAMMSVFYDFPVSNEDPLQRASDYLSVNLWKFDRGNPSHVSVPVDFTLQWTNTSQNASVPTCQFLISNLTSADNETFSDFGCHVVAWDKDEVTCRCNHTTHFAVLLKAFGDTVSPQHDSIMRIMSLVLGGLSVACLVVTALVFVACHETLIKDRMLIHFHLVLALLGGYISLLLSALFTSPDEVWKTCVGCAVVSHFFFLAVFFWSLVEGFYLFYKIVLVFERKWVECLPTYAPILGWLCPLVVVVGSFVLSRTAMAPGPADTYQDSYVNPNTCFLNERSGMIWFFMGPVVAIILLNLLILIKVMTVIYKAASSSTRLAAADKSTRVNESLRRASRGALILMPILSLPWIIGFLYNFYTADSTVGVVVGTAGAYIQVLLAGTQGILVFLFYCVYNADVRNAYQLSARRRKSVSSLQSSNPSQQRKRSRIPLLFSSGDTHDSTLRSNRSNRSVQRSNSQSVGYGFQTRRSTSASVHPLTANGMHAYGRSTSNESTKIRQTELT